MVKKDNPTKSSISNLITTIFITIVGLFISILVTRSLGTELKGELANINLIITFFAPIFLFGYHQGVLFYGLKKEINLQEFFWTGWLMTLIISVLIVGLFYILITIGVFGKIIKNVELYTLGIGLSGIPLIFLNNYSEKVLRTYHLFKVSNKRKVLGLAITFIFYLILFVFFHINFQTALIGIILGFFVQQILNIVYVKRYLKVENKISFNSIIMPWNYGIKIWVNGIIAKSNDKFDLVILTYLLNSSSFGIYSVGVGLSNMLLKLPNSYIDVFYNELINKKTEDSLILYTKIQRITFLITLISTIFLCVLAYPLVNLMYGKAFSTAAWVVIFYTPGLIFLLMARLSIKFYAAQGRPFKNSMIYLVGLLVSLPFYFLLIPKYGIKGAAISSSIAYLSSFLFSFYQIYKEYNISIVDLFKIKKEDITFLKSRLKGVPIIGRLLS